MWLIKLIAIIFIISNLQNILTKKSYLIPFLFILYFIFGLNFTVTIVLFVFLLIIQSSKNRNAFTFTGNQTQAEVQQQFFESLFAIMGCVSKAKGNVTKEDIDLAMMTMTRVKMQAEQQKKAQAAFNRGKQEGFPLVETLRQVKATVRRNDLLQFFLELQISAALADGALHPNELKILRIIARELGFSDNYLQRRIQIQEAIYRFQKTGQGQSSYQQYSRQHSQSNYQQQTQSAHSQLNDAYQIIGVDPKDDNKTIKQAYRKLMNEHHPDKLVSKGLPPELLEAAKKKAEEIQTAYNLIKKHRGFK